MMHYFDIFLLWQGWLYLLILTLLEVVLGIDNIIFISIVTDELPLNKKRSARNIGLGLALIIRLVLLAAVAWLMSLTKPIFSIFSIGFSFQSIILLLGGLFLIYKSTIEMHRSVKGFKEDKKAKKTTISAIILQIIIIDVVFSFDSIISAVGMTNGLQTDTGENPITIIYISVIISMAVMMIFAGKISQFIADHPTIKMIALSFLVTVGVLLIGEAFGAHIPKGYVYFSLVFSLIVELMNIKMRKNKTIT
jgi:predicted tellurium resistance membrane protein TerC